MSEKPKRGPGRPRKIERRVHFDVSCHADTLAFLDWLAGDGNRSDVLEQWIRAHPRYADWLARHKD